MRLPIVLAVILALVAAQGFCEPPAKSMVVHCPMKSRCCRMLPPQPSDAVAPKTVRVAALVVTLPAVVSAPSPLPVGAPSRPAPVREVPTRTIQLRI